MKFPLQIMRAIGVVLMLTASVHAVRAGPLAYPPSPSRPVQDVYQGVTVTDDYRWLEATDSKEVVDWIARQNALTRRSIDALPRRQAIKQELLRMAGSGRASRYAFQLASGRLFAMKFQPPRNQEMLVVLNPNGDVATERIVLDPNRLDRSGKTTIDWFVASPDGRLVALSLSRNGSEDGTLRIYDVATARPLTDSVPRVQYPTGGGSAAWAADGKGLYYTRYPQGSERPPEDANFYQQVWFHRLGTPAAADSYVIGKGVPAHRGDRAARQRGQALSPCRRVQRRWRRACLLPARRRPGHLAAHRRQRRRLPARRVRARRPALCARTERLAARAHRRDGAERCQGRTAGARRRWSPSPMPSSKTSCPARAASTSSCWSAARRSCAPSRSTASRSMRSIRNRSRVPRSACSSTATGSCSAARASSGAFAWYAYDGTRAMKTRLSDPPAYAMDGGLSDAEAVREFAVSKDGTKVPVNIVRMKGTPLDGSQPVLLTAYGGYGVSERPYFSRQTVAWLRHGGVFALANLRGGGEFGEEWHLAGNLTRKQNVFDDFIASAELLIARGYTSSARLAIEGGSNGGLLMGAVLVQRPDLFRAVVTSVGIYDMLRVELTPNGAFNVTEFGSVREPDQFKALYAYSPLHHVQDGTAYPAVLLTTGEHDGRVAPWMSYKMAARLQTANPNGRPILLRVASDAGHGIGTSLASEIDDQADAFAFLFDQLGMR